MQLRKTGSKNIALEHAVFRIQFAWSIVCCLDYALPGDQSKQASPEVAKNIQSSLACDNLAVNSSTLILFFLC